MTRIETSSTSSLSRVSTAATTTVSTTRGRTHGAKRRSSVGRTRQATPRTAPHRSPNSRPRWRPASSGTDSKDPDVTVAFGSGHVYSTVRDLALWDRTLTGESPLKATQRELLFTPNLNHYGYGGVIEKKAGATIEWHNGALSPLGFTALVVRFPAKDRFLAYLSNFDVPLIQPFEANVEALAVK